MSYVGIITCSDKGSKFERIDESGKMIKDFMESKGLTVVKYTILPDEKEILKEEMINMADNLGVNLILTTGGTGFSQRDCMPEATLDVVERIVPGIPEAMRSLSMKITKRAMLSRAVAGIRNKTLIINMPGSPKAVSECLDFIITELHHGLDILQGNTSNCARK